MHSSIYPPSPEKLPTGFTALPSSYHLKAVTAILAVIVFFILYVALIVATAYLVKLAVIYDMGSVNKLTILLKIGAILGAAMLFVFTLKFIFNLKNPQITNRVELDMTEQKPLQEFINLICKETGAPKPRKVFVDPDVNAYVAYSNTWLSLILPVKKDLTIGLALVDALNRQEFKAVMSHEFGHFGQRSMKIGSYIFSANTIIHDMIYNRDKWDELLDQWRGTDIRLSAAAWVVTPIIWVIRNLLKLFYMLLNNAYASLSREMEFNADKVAVSTSGSEAIVSALWRLDPAVGDWNACLQHAFHASEKGIYVRNLYAHLSEQSVKTKAAIETTEQSLKENELGGKEYFTSSEHSKVGMYTSHPPNDHRERNAKTPFIACDADTDSAWSLINKKDQVCTELSKLVYASYFSKTVKTVATDEAFRNFILHETKDKEVHDKYENVFGMRFFKVPEISDGISQSIDKETFVLQMVSLRKELAELLTPIRALDEKLVLAETIAEGTSRLKSLEFNGKEFKRKEMQEAYQAIFQEKDSLLEKSFVDWDKKFYRTTSSMANTLNKGRQLSALFDQHKQIADCYRIVINAKNDILGKLAKLQQNEEVEQYELKRFVARINEHISTINNQLDTLKLLKAEGLTNIDSGEDLVNAIIPGGKIKAGSTRMFENEDFGRVLNDVERCITGFNRIDQKSFGAVLHVVDELENS